MGTKVVIPAAGLGTRMLPATKEQPKEMLPIFAQTSAGEVCLKPVLHLVFEQLYNFGFREFCFIIGRGKRAIEDYFTPDAGNINLLRNKGKESPARELEQFYEKINTSKVVWINQPEPRGFGDAVLQAQPFIGSSKTLVHAGDTYISSQGSHLKRLIDAATKYDADAAFAVKRVPDPRQFGVILCRPLDETVLQVLDAVEKPQEPPTDYAIMPIYIFKPMIFDYLATVKPDSGGEIQLTSGIKGMIDSNEKVIATCLRDDEYWLDIGTPRTYWEALKTSYHFK